MQASKQYDPRTFVMKDNKSPVAFLDKTGQFIWLNPLGEYLPDEIELVSTSFPFERITIGYVKRNLKTFQNPSWSKIAQIRKSINQKQAV